MTIRSPRKAFTLIELLTVMAIITLLIGILTPAVGAARDRARQTAVKAQINAMEVGLEAFNADQGFYPPSNPGLYTTDPGNLAGTRAAQITDWELGNGADELQGAHLVLDALVGRDFLGYDPKAPPPGASGVGYDRWNPNNDRRQPYISVDGVSTTSRTEPPTDGFGTVPSTAPTGNPQPTLEGPAPLAGGTSLLCRVFRDRFGWPILYYRANPSATANSPIISQTDTVPPPTIPVALLGNGVYDGLDNEGFTSYDTVSPYNRRHRIADAKVALTAASFVGTTITNGLPGGGTGFAEFIRSIRATTYQQPPNNTLLQTPRPVKADRFILLSAGKDGAFGNLDDVANFSVLSTDR